jgi:anti-sigma regulatory factor (Ser/Thr protein kinase)
MHTEPSSQLTLRAQPSELGRLNSWIQGLCELHQLPERVSFQLDLCATELVTNVISYAYPQGQAPQEAVALRFERNPAEVLLELVDWGVEFDPLAYVPAPPPRTLEEASIGGRGLLLVRRLAGQLLYSREPGCNRLVLIFPAPQCTL